MAQNICFRMDLDVDVSNKKTTIMGYSKEWDFDELIVGKWENYLEAVDWDIGCLSGMGDQPQKQTNFVGTSIANVLMAVL